MGGAYFRPAYIRGFSCRDISTPLFSDNIYLVLDLQNLHTFRGMQSPSAASPKRRTSLHNPGAFLSVLLVLLILPSDVASQCPGSQCIRSQPMPSPLALGEAQLDTALVALRCELVCINEVCLHANDSI